MLYYFAPMEGVTTAQYRTLHAEIFGGADRYYTPFLSPTADHRLTPREKRQILPEHNASLPVIPQLLTASAEDFLWAADALAQMGYGEVNLNLGCPSATVTAKGKGSGLLRTPEKLERMLDEIFKRAEVRVSVKTRIGYKDAAEFPALLSLYARYPIAELILHCRTRDELYNGAVHPEAYALAREKCPFALCYNGDLLLAEDVRGFEASQPDERAVMLGRGAADDPALFRVLRGGQPASREELRQFHESLYAVYREEYGRVNGMRRMKELWNYLLHLFEDADEVRKTMMRTKDVYVFEDAVSTALGSLRLKSET